MNKTVTKGYKEVTKDGRKVVKGAGEEQINKWIFITFVVGILVVSVIIYYLMK